MLEHAHVLVEVERDAHRAGVRMDAQGDLWLAHWHAARPGRVAGARLDGPRPARIDGRDEGRPDWAALGGRLPPGAAAADVRDDAGAWCRAAAGHGAWVVFVARSTRTAGLPPVRFVDAAGALTPARPRERLLAGAPLDGERRRLLAHAGTTGGGPCPVCGGDDWRTEPFEPPSSGLRIFCAACGFDDGAARAFWAPAARER